MRVAQEQLVGEDRVRWLGEVRRVAETPRQNIEVSFRLRPRERAAVNVRARVAAQEASLRWVITPTDGAQCVPPIELLQ